MMVVLELRAPTARVKARVWKRQLERHGIEGESGRCARACHGVRSHPRGGQRGDGRRAACRRRLRRSAPRCPLRATGYGLCVRELLHVRRGVGRPCPPGQNDALLYRPMTRATAFKMIKRRAAHSGLPRDICAHSFCGTGITEYLRRGGDLKVAARIGPVRRGGAAGAAGRWKGIRDGDPFGLARARP